MAVYNTSSDSANTMIRAFLTKVGEAYLGHSFNTGSGKGKEIWNKIKIQSFENRCAFCHSESEKLTIEHLIMFNRDQCGLQHPGNVVPCCVSCNKRGKHPGSGKYISWVEQLEATCVTIEDLRQRKEIILKHIENENYPKLTEMRPMPCERLPKIYMNQHLQNWKNP